MKQWKLTIEKTDLGPAVILPDDLLEKLGVGVDDWLQFNPSARGYIVEKALDKDSPENAFK